MVKVNIDDSLFARAKSAAASVGYSGVDEFVAHCIETELKKLKLEEAEEQVSNQLRGLGYIE